MFLLVRIAGAVTRATLVVDSSYQLGERCVVRLELLRGLPFKAGLLEMCITVTNSPFRYAKTHTVQEVLSTRMPACDLDLIGDMYGITQVAVESAFVTDPLRLFRARIPMSEDHSCVIYPPSVETDVSFLQTPKTQLMGDTFDNTKSGNDVGEVFDVRDYREGDQLSSIHWKLSSKFDSLISREFSKSADFDVAIIACTCREDHGRELVNQKNDGVAAMALSISESLLRSGIFHDAGLISEQQLHFHLIDGMPARTAYAEDMMVAPITQTAHEVSMVMLNSSIGDRFAKVALVTSYYDEELWVNLSQDVDLTVIVISSDASSTSEDERYTLYSLQMGGLSEHVHHISI